MAGKHSHETMPYKGIAELKRSIVNLQNKPGDTSSKELLDSMAGLTQSMNNMLHLFSSAAEEMKLEERTESELSQKIAPLIEKVNNLDKQNKTIAEGLVAIADMVKDIKEGKGEITPPKKPEVFEKPKPPELSPLAPPRGTFPSGSPRIVARRPMPPGMPPMGPPPRGPRGPALGELPPLPPLEEEPDKRKFFGMFKK